MIEWFPMDTITPDANVNILIMDSQGGISVTKTNSLGQIKYRSYRMKRLSSEYYMSRKHIKHWAPLSSIAPTIEEVALGLK